MNAVGSVAGWIRVGRVPLTGGALRAWAEAGFGHLVVLSDLELAAIHPAARLSAWHLHEESMTDPFGGVCDGGWSDVVDLRTRRAIIRATRLVEQRAREGVPTVVTCDTGRTLAPLVVACALARLHGLDGAVAAELTPGDLALPDGLRDEGVAWARGLP